MDFFKRLFGGGSGVGNNGDSGLYFYVQPNGCQEIVRVRIDRNNDMSVDDDNSTLFVRKTVRGTTYRCTRSAEVYAVFSADRSRVENLEITGGKQVDEAAYTAWLAAQE